ncbi:MAG: ADP-ribosylglycohydrolase family protein [Acidaminococcaceae bacterium]|nr:ADP-ribosylglycohydrolase family protein [Acidaminococcaceae bacterium]
MVYSAQAAESNPPPVCVLQPVDEIHRRVQIVFDRGVVLCWRRGLQQRGEAGQRVGLRAAFDGFQYPLQEGVLLFPRFQIEIRDYIESNFYKIDFTLDGIRPTYSFDVTCQGSVPQAFEAFFESTGFEDAVRNAVSIGGDSDTIAAITGSIAEAYYSRTGNIITQVFFQVRNNVKLLWKNEVSVSEICCYKI